MVHLELFRSSDSEVIMEKKMKIVKNNLVQIKVILLRGDDIGSGLSSVRLHFRTNFLGVSVLGTCPTTGFDGITQ